MALIACSAVLANAQEKKKFYIGALGDSLSTGFDAASSLRPEWQGGDKHREYSWIEGKSTDFGFKSHLQRLQEEFPGAEFRVENAATFGRQSKDLVDQINRLREKSKTRGAKYDLITIEIGGNDLCRTEDHFDRMIQVYETNLREAVQLIVNGKDKVHEPLLSPRGKVLILEIPDVYHIWHMYYDLKANPNSVPHLYSWAHGCGTKWTFANVVSRKICQPLFGHDPTDVELPKGYEDIYSQTFQLGRRAHAVKRAFEFRKRWSAISDKIIAITKEFPAHIVYHPSQFPNNKSGWEFTWEDISPIDCFHPSIEGQGKISQRAWEPKMFEDWKK